MEDCESVALQHNLAILSSYPVCFVYPEGLDVSLFSRLCPSAEFCEVSPDWLGLRRGISGYNEMMMSKDFYDLFSDCEYILICHLDAWIFRDELAEWCRRGYDIVAAPWPVRPRYRHFPLRQYIWLKSTLWQVVPRADVRKDRQWRALPSQGCFFFTGMRTICRCHFTVQCSFGRHA